MGIPIFLLFGAISEASRKRPLRLWMRGVINAGVIIGLIWMVLDVLYMATSGGGNG